MDDKSFFFRSMELRKVHSCFMKECLLESLKRLVESQAETESRDVSSALNDTINGYRSSGEDGFNYYPDIYECDISKKLLKKEELRRHIIQNEVGTIEDKCDSNFFELAPHQLLLKNLFSPNSQYRGLLIFHGVGVGKTCSGISIAENFKDVYGEKENRIIVLASANIQIGWRKTIYDPKKGTDQCTGGEYAPLSSEPFMDEKQQKKKIKKYYELHGYAAFANSVKKLVEEQTSHIIDEKERFMRQTNIIKETYSDRVLIIDEVHNIRTGESQKESRTTIQYIEMVIRYSDNLRLILLTANPMYNMSSEIIWILNMLLINDNRTTIAEKDIFDKEGDLINGSKLKEKSSGYISYLRGENPISFPVKLYPRHDPDKVMTKHNCLGIDIFGKPIDEDKLLSFLELYSSSLKGHQLKIYMNECIKFKDQEKLRIEDETVLLQLSDIVYPGSEDDGVDSMYGGQGLLNNMNKITKKNSVQYSYKAETLRKYGEFFKVEKIGDYSSKIHDILKVIERSDGIVFIYTNWIKSGVIPLVLALEQHGYKKHDGKTILKTAKKIPPISYEGKRSHEYPNKEDFISAKYMVIAGKGENMTQNLEAELREVTSDVAGALDDNKEGKKIKIIIGSSVASEGLDFKNIRSIHILEPWHNINKLEQVIGRGIRNCSHKNLSPKERNVTVYLHASSIPEIETIDMHLYRYSEFKAKKIGEIETILKQSAIDKYFFKSANYLSEKDIGRFTVQPSYLYGQDRKAKTFPFSAGDKEYSRVCSFSEVCDYMADDPVPAVKADKDTFQIQYSGAIIEIYKRVIHNLYKDSPSYSLSEIKHIVSEYKDIHMDFLYHALREMIIEKYTLHNKHGDKGYLTDTDGFYAFQPYFNKDPLLPAYYRLNKGEAKMIAYNIESKDKRSTVILQGPQVFTDEIILKTYQKIRDFRMFSHETKILGYLDLDNENFIKYSYIFDRLDFQDKLIIGYSLMIYLKEDTGSGNDGIEDPEFLDILVLCFRKLFMYHDGSKFSYKDQYESKSKDNLCGFFLYHNVNKKVIFYQYSHRSVEMYNKIDEMDIVRMIKKNAAHPSLMPSGSWGFTIYSDRLRLSDSDNTHNGIVLKVIKSTEKLREQYTYPPGPGVVIQDSGGLGSWQSAPMKKFIEDELKDHLGKMNDQDREIFLSANIKRDFVVFIEMSFRMTGNLIQNDIIFMKYY